MKIYSRRNKKSIYSNKPVKLPSTYLELFFDTIKQNWRTIIGMGLLSLVFFIPSLIFMFWNDLYFLQLLSTPNLEIETIDKLRITATNFFNIFVCIGIVFASIGISGIARLNLLVAREEGTIFFKDFNKGVKQNIKNNFVVILIYAIALYGTLWIANSFKGDFIIYLPFTIVQTILFPLVLIVIETNSIYSWSIKDSIINAFYIYIKNFIFIVLISILFTSIMLIDVIQYIVLKYVLMLLIIILIYPFVILGVRVYFNKILDRDINKKHYPEIYKKGIYEKADDNYLENVICKYYGETSTFHSLKFDPFLDQYYYHLCSYLDEKTNIKTTTIYQDNGVWPLNPVIESLNFIRGLAYKKQLTYLQKNLYSVMGLRQEEKAKVAIVLAGGGYSEVCTLPEDLPVSVELYKKGFNVFSFVYPCKNQAKNALKCLKSFIEFLFKNEDKMNIDMSNYIVIGFSAGAHLAASLSTDNLGLKERKPRLLGLCYPVISMGEHCHVDSRTNLLGEDITQEEMDQYSIHLHVGEDYSNVFIWQCDKDNVVPFENSLLMVEALKKAGVDYRFESFDDVVHGYAIAKGKIADGWLDRMVEYYLSMEENE